MAGLLCDLLWSDPEADIAGWAENDRGVSYTFGADVVSKFLVKHDYDLNTTVRIRAPYYAYCDDASCSRILQVLLPWTATAQPSPACATTVPCHSTPGAGV